jgi:myo-inositol-1(or 4)-monophosphatase
MTNIMDVARAAARAAGGLLLRRLPRQRVVSYKGLRDIVTDADVAAQGAIVARLRAAFPAHLILAEEGQQDIDLNGAAPVWVVDPLDGTTNYARRFPVFSVSLALAERGAPVLGVVHDPRRRETFFAVRGEGAWMQRGTSAPRALRVSVTDEMAEALVGVDWAREPDLRARTLAALNRAASACRSVRSTGSAALALAYVAAGCLDAYYHLNLQPWDVAAAALIIQEAGGTLTTPGGAPWRLGEPRVAASNGRLHARFLAELSLPD